MPTQERRRRHEERRPCRPWQRAAERGEQHPVGCPQPRPRQTLQHVWLRRLYVLFFIELANPRVHFGGVTANPHERWVTRQARNLVMTLAEREQPVRFLVRDRDGKFTRSFDEVFRSEGIRVIPTPVRAPQAKAHAERWVGSLRRECLDRILILVRRHREQVCDANASTGS